MTPVIARVLRTRELTGDLERCTVVCVHPFPVNECLRLEQLRVLQPMLEVHAFSFLPSFRMGALRTTFVLAIRA